VNARWHGILYTTDNWKLLIPENFLKFLLATQGSVPFLEGGGEEGGATEAESQANTKVIQKN
jgi:hypothetical protein